MCPEIETTVDSSVAPVAKVAKKSVKKPAAKVADKKAPAKTAKKDPVKKAPAAPREKKEGLRKPQVRILACLAKANKPLSRATIAEKSPVDVASCVEYLGSNNDEVRLANDEKHFPSLISLKHVRFAASPEGEGAMYEITAAGKKALETAKKAE